MLHGERVTLRALEPADAAVMWRWYQDREFSTLDGNRYGTALPPLEESVRSHGSLSFVDVSLGIEDEHARLIGIVRLKSRGGGGPQRGFRHRHRARPLGPGLRDGRTRTILRFAFTEMNLHRVSLGVLDYNARARRCYEKCGFREEGRVREHHFHDGRWHDQIMMGILQHEFERDP